MKGKDKCKILKELRSEIAKNNDIEYVVSECKHQGECRGTCPKCEAEVAYLERELEKRRTLGKKVVLAGLGIGVAATIGGCTNPVVDYVIEPVMDVLGIGAQPLSGAAETLEGDVTYTTETWNISRKTNPKAEVKKSKNLREKWQKFPIKSNQKEEKHWKNPDYRFLRSTD